MTSETVQRPRPGPHNPVESTPPRTPGSVRRTTSVDTTFPDGVGGRVVLYVRGRDLLTNSTGAPHVLDELSVDVELEPWSGTITGVDASSASARLDALTGSPFRGLRRRLTEMYPDDAAVRTLCFSALEDLGGAYLVSGYAGLRGGHIPTDPQVAKFAVELQGTSAWGGRSTGR